MKNKKLHRTKAYWILTRVLVVFLSGCQTKKSKTDFKETKAETIMGKSFFEALMSFESDKITITDKACNKTEITNPRINKKSSQSNDVAKSEQTLIFNTKKWDQVEKVLNYIDKRRVALIQNDLFTDEERDYHEWELKIVDKIKSELLGLNPKN